MHLWAMLVFFGVNAADMLDTLAFSTAFSAPSMLYQWQNVLIPGFMISIYFFVRGLTSSNPMLRTQDCVHAVPFVIALLCLMPSLALPGAVRMGLSPASVSVDYQRLVDLGENAFWVLWIVVLFVYGALCVRRLIQHKRNIRDVFSDIDGKTLRWLDVLVCTIFVLAAIVIIDEILILMGQPEIRVGTTAMLFDVILAGSFGLFALRASPPLPRWSESVLLAQADPSEQMTKAASQTPSRYARSGLKKDDLDRYAHRLERRMSEGQLWRDHSLNLRGLAAEIAIPAIHLSEVLNTNLSMSFYDYINQCRVQDACELLATTNQTILEISETVGFNAKSTFNTSFKKVTDQTPSQWRKTHYRG